jgi:hypothetical protein
MASGSVPQRGVPSRCGFDPAAVFARAMRQAQNDLAICRVVGVDDVAPLLRVTVPDTPVLLPIILRGNEKTSGVARRAGDSRLLDRDIRNDMLSGG